MAIAYGSFFGDTPVTGATETMSYPSRSSLALVASTFSACVKEIPARSGLARLWKQI